MKIIIEKKDIQCISTSKDNEIVTISFKNPLLKLGPKDTIVIPIEEIEYL